VKIDAPTGNGIDHGEWIVQGFPQQYGYPPGDQIAVPASHGISN
jgi:hypothetical protein